jgi:histidine triad (HIT) family protein
MTSIFTKIVKGEIPSYKIAETDNCLAFLDVFPLVKGHTLVIPKQEIDYIFDVDDALLSELHIFSKKVAHVIEKAIPCKRIGVAVIGLEVPHAHIHMVPLNRVGDLDFSKPKLTPTAEELKQIQEQIRQQWAIINK